ncbi:cellulose biosynthesis protein BcsP [Undibacterium sp. JH2W]|uniref:cellulose biosynthesis protein BcsP n=1 Tax=Undibacterium sp. JH2W TaxID=3413037 RepID=UPI003BF132E9
MDDDVKNLFQKFGQSTDAYREINRDADSELAKQRWPLLRDVHLHAAPAPVRAMPRVEEITPPAPVHHHEDAFRSAAIKSTASRATLVKATSATPVVANTAANSKSAVQLPLKQLLMQPPVMEESEVEPAPAPAFLSKIMPAAQRKNVSEQKKSDVASSFFANREQASNGHEAAPVQTATAVKSSAPVFPGQKNAKSPTVLTQTATPGFLHGIAGHAMPEKLAVASNEEVAVPAMVSNTATSATIEKPVSAVFGRLAGKQEEAKPVNAATNSFFNKIFKP